MKSFGFRVKYIERGEADVEVEANSLEEARANLNDPTYVIDWDTTAFDGREVEIITEFGDLSFEEE